MVELSRLKAVLAEEVRLLEEMVDIEEKTGRILIEGDAGALQGFNLRKEELVEKMKEMEQQRGMLLPRGLTLKEFYHRESTPGAGELENLRIRILQLYTSLQRRLKVNRHLLKHNLQFMEYALNIIFPRKDEPLYSSSGQVKLGEGFSSGLLDSSV
jgi:flagellar biosynthesis/type III secretory pathway chaperone